jgi:hypothetical protein
VTKFSPDSPIPDGQQIGSNLETIALSITSNGRAGNNCVRLVFYYSGDFSADIGPSERRP